MTITEQGGPTTIGGTSYQAWVAAKWLAQLLRHVTKHDNPVVEVRLEGRTEVDDIEVLYADGTRLHVQAKRRITEKTDAWTEFWTRARDFTNLPERKRKAMLAIGEGDERWEGLATALDQARDAPNADDFEQGLRGVVKDAVEKVATALGNPGIPAVMQVLGKTRLERMTEDRLRMEVAKSLPRSSMPPSTIATVLAEIATANGMRRRNFTVVVLRRELARRGVSVDGPRASLATYLDTMERNWANVGVSDYIQAPAERAFVWPTLEHPVRDSPQDRFAEHRVLRGQRAEDPRTLLEKDGQCTLLVAGAGFGKSSFLKGLARQALSSDRVPIIVSLPVYAAADHPYLPGLLSWVEQDMESRFSVCAPWEALAARGQLCMLFDGLDEVPREVRATIITRLKDFASQYVRVPCVIATRDTGSVAVPLNVEERTLGRLEEEELQRFFDGYVGKELAERIMQGLHSRRMLMDLAALPLVATMLAGFVKRHGIDNLPPGPGPLLDDFVEYSLSPEREGVQLSRQPRELREAAGRLAYAGMKEERQLWTPDQARRDLTDMTNADEVLEELRRAGLLLRVDRKLRFVLPIMQEYLAGTHLAHVEPERIAPMMLEQATRPWAQTAQFALITVRAADDAIAKVLQAPDDTFGTNLTAVGRAIAWGAAVTPSTRADIGERLAHLHLSHRAGTHLDVGDILQVAYGNAPPEVILAYLRQYGFGGTVINHLAAKAPDDVLVEALKSALDHKDFGLWIPSPLEQRIVALGMPALDLIEKQVRESSSRTNDAISLLRRFSEDPQYQSDLLARHEASPLPTRAAIAVYAGSGRITEVEDDLVALFEGSDSEMIPEELWVHPEPKRVLDRVMVSMEVSPVTKGNLIWDLVNQDDKRFDAWLKALMEKGAQSGVRAQMYTAFACLRDDVDSFLNVCRLTPNGDMITWTCLATCLGKFEQREGVDALRCLADSELSNVERRELLTQLWFPMKYATKPFGWRGGGVGVRERRHPAMPVAHSIAEPLVQSVETDPFLQLENLTLAAQFEISEAADLLPRMIEEGIRATEVESTCSDDAWYFDRVITEAVRAAPWKLEHEPFLVELAINHDGWNIPRTVVTALCSLREHQLEDLLTWHNLRFEKGLDDCFRDAIREAAIRRKCRIVEGNNGLLRAESWLA